MGVAAPPVLLLEDLDHGLGDLRWFARVKSHGVPAGSCVWVWASRQIIHSHTEPGLRGSGNGLGVVAGRRGSWAWAGAASILCWQWAVSDLDPVLDLLGSSEQTPHGQYCIPVCSGCCKTRYCKCGGLGALGMFCAGLEWNKQALVPAVCPCQCRSHRLPSWGDPMVDSDLRCLK